MKEILTKARVKVVIRKNFYFRLVWLSTHALHTKRINLSPFTKDFRVWGAPNENIPIFL